uniref:NB-ARC domain-containing protein n=1 Tax=Aegilops tauschii TaxID=37682 RepID=N1QXE5_AEGTA
MSGRCPDMENCINELMRDTEGAHANAGFVNKMAQCLRSLGIQHQITNRIEEVKVLMVEVAGLVGVDGLREELVSLLTDSQKKLKVVSIMGFGGLGKITVAKQVYDEIGGNLTVPMRQSGLVGVDGQREEHVSVLADSKKKLKVVLIMGFGGLGKAMLATQVYDEIGGNLTVRHLSQSPKDQM